MKKNVTFKLKSFDLNAGGNGEHMKTILRYAINSSPLLENNKVHGWLSGKKSTLLELNFDQHKHLNELDVHIHGTSHFTFSEPGKTGQEWHNYETLKSSTYQGYKSHNKVEHLIHLSWKGQIKLNMFNTTYTTAPS
jgi:hypothetical protein